MIFISGYTVWNELQEIYMFFSTLPPLTLLCFFFLHDHPFFTLAGILPNSYAPIDTTTSSTSSNSKLVKLVIAFGIKNTIATGVIILITLLNVFVYKLRQLHEDAFGQDIESSSLDKQCRRFSITEIQSATHNFDDALVIGKGGFGKVYKGVLDDGSNSTAVAVKRLNTKSRQGAREFWTEINMLSEYRHSHLVSLIGYCNDFHEMILVYEYMPNGTLADHLYKIRRNSGTTIISRPLSWEQRLKICIGAARGLDYLHTGTGVQHRVIHRDVKSSNILLDENFVAKISDFGLSKIGPANQSCSHISTNIKGTFGYLDPEYFLTRRLTRKSDVYSFGVVLFEVLCGRPAVDHGLDWDKQALALCVQSCIKEGTLDEIIDLSLRDQISQDCHKAFVEIAHRCLLNHSNKRPTMAEVVAKLEFSLALQQSKESFILGNFLLGSGGKPDDSKELINVDNGLHHNHPINEIIPICNASGSAEKSGVLTSVKEKRKRKMLQAIGIMTKGNNNPKKDSTTSNRTGPSWSWHWKSFWPKRMPSTRREPLPFRDPYLNNVQIREFSVAEIKAATKCFHKDRKVADTEYTEVFKGYIDGHKEVAIKRFRFLTCKKGVVKYYADRDCRRFCKEIMILTKTNHQNVVSLGGYCCHKDESCLVYAYMSNGSLHDHLDSNDPLPWKRRIQICIGAARGLNYFHTGVAGLTVVHGAVTPTAILLDENWVPKISGLGCCNCSDSFYADSGNVIIGTYAYSDPEYLMSGQLSEKLDVYSIGAILWRVLLSVVDLNTDSLSTRTINSSIRKIISSIRNSTLHKLIDPYLMGKIAPECLIEFVDIALNCVRDRGIERPPMVEVVKRIEFALELQEKAEAATHHFDGTNNTPAGSGFELDGNIYPQLSDCVNKLSPASAPVLEVSDLSDCVDKLWPAHVWEVSDLSVANFDFDSMAFPR